MPALTCTMDAHFFHILVPDHLLFQADGCGKECFITVANLTEGLQVSDVMFSVKFTLQALVVFRSLDYNSSIILVFSVDRELES